ncbi:MAG: hypothetical protein KC457_35795, partial [Myxococcales bacterium]|nr:hypothetical protein [Myxococcales bacterium]
VRGAMTKLVLRMAGVWQRLGQSKLWRTMTRDRGAAGRSCGRVLGWEFERVIMAHGEIVEGGDARDRLRDGVEWMLEGSERAAA